MTLKFTPLASGSSGNCTYVGTEKTNILIDAGISGKKIESCLNEISLSCKDIDAIFVTHEHYDHIAGVGVISRKYNIPVYATSGTWQNMPVKVGEISPENKKYISSNDDVFLNDIRVKAFDIPHDATEPVAYSIFNEKFKVAIATDIGHVTETVLENIRYCNALLLESNHDINMLKNGAYPYSIKQRILGKYGHLSNDTAGKLLCCVMNENLKDVYIGHISQDNNKIETAYNNMVDIMSKYGIIAGEHLNLHIAPLCGVNSLVTA